MDIKTELRKLSPGHLRNLVEILEYAESWKKLMEIIPKTLHANNFNCVLANENCAKFNSDHFRLIENASENFRKRNSEILLDEWGTSGKVRPSLGHLLDLLKRAELFRAADYVAVDILGLEPPPRPENGPAAAVIYNLHNHSKFDNNVDKTINNNIDQMSLKKGMIPKIIITQDSNDAQEVSDMIKFSTDKVVEDSCTENESSDNLPKISALLKEESETNIPQISVLMESSEIVPTTNESGNSNLPLFSDLMQSNDYQKRLPHFSYKELESSTKNFDEESDRFLGKGSFGSVYLADGLLNSQIAIKKLQSNGLTSEDKSFKQFRTELEILCNISHENLLPIRGFSCDGPAYCILYDYIPGGDLEKALQTRKESIIWTDRIHIAKGICDGIFYLHTAFASPIIHRDIKSANILLTSGNRAKLCDFGVIKILKEQDISASDSIIGTNVYMAPEVFRLGDVSEKSDIFSFGVVLLELLTALPAFDANRENVDLISYVNDICDDKSIEPVLDSSTGNWIKDETFFAEGLFSIALECLEEKPERLENKQVVDLLNKLSLKLK